MRNTIATYLYTFLLWQFSSTESVKNRTEYGAKNKWTKSMPKKELYKNNKLKYIELSKSSTKLFCRLVKADIILFRTTKKKKTW